MTRRPTTTERGYGWVWQQRRRVILERDGYRCRCIVRRGGVFVVCGKPATCVDHIIHIGAPGWSHDPSNLRAACVSCNNRNRRPKTPRRRLDRDWVGSREW